MQGKIEAARDAERAAEMREQNEKVQRTRRRQEKTIIEQVMNNTTTRQIGRTVARELTRGLLSVLGVKKR